MDHLLFVGDIMARYRCSRPTAIKRMRQMIHMERPLAVTEWAVKAWEDERTVNPADAKKAAVKPLKTRHTGPIKLERRRA